MLIFFGINRGVCKSIRHLLSRKYSNNIYFGFIYGTQTNLKIVSGASMLFSPFSIQDVEYSEKNHKIKEYWSICSYNYLTFPWRVPIFKHEDHECGKKKKVKTTASTIHGGIQTWGRVCDRLTVLNSEEAEENYSLRWFTRAYSNFSNT